MTAFAFCSSSFQSEYTHIQCLVHLQQIRQLTRQSGTESSVLGDHRLPKAAIRTPRAAYPETALQDASILLMDWCLHRFTPSLLTYTYTYHIIQVEEEGCR